MDRPTFVLAAMAAAGPEARFDPVRLQKFFFLLDRELDGECGCPHFNFRPYDYGPFDEAVYRQIERLAARGLATIDEARPYRLYGLTAKGFRRGELALVPLPDRVGDYLATVSEWVFSLDFRDLLTSIYEYAPDMAVRSVLPQLVTAPCPDHSHPFARGMARAFEWPGLTGRSSDGKEDVTAALGRHWAAVGGYLRDAMGRSGPASGES